jgi:hypothetical protein
MDGYLRIQFSGNAKVTSNGKADMGDDRQILPNTIFACFIALQGSLFRAISFPFPFTLHQ